MSICCPVNVAVVVHAVGKMELFSGSFYPAVLAVLDNPHLLAFGSVPVARYGRAIPQVRGACAEVKFPACAGHSTHAAATLTLPPVCTRWRP